jgi:crotonobetainyl-CoA:carnitine CoA-transferase CaiB-like acyl-CoA transferase
VCDPIAGLHAAFAAVAALVVRDRDGIGVHVESTMVEAALNVAAEMLVEHSRNGIELCRQGNRGPGASPQGVYRCTGDDEWVALAALNDTARSAMAALVERSELGPDESSWRERADEIDKLIADWAARRAVSDAVRVLRSAGVAAAPVRTPAGLLTDLHLLDRGFWERVDHPVVGSFLCTGMPFMFVGKPRRWIHRGAPLYGEHTSDVLTELGYRRADLEEMAQARITAARPAGL